MKSFIVYDPSSGDILRYGTCPDSMLSVQARSGELVVEGVADPRTQYVDGGNILSRASLGASIDRTSVPADGATAVNVTGLPNPTAFRVSGPAVAYGTTADGGLALTFNLPGTYVLSLRAPRKSEQLVTINAS